MAIPNCPNKNLKEWQDVVDYFNGNESMAMSAFIVNGDEIPTLEQLEERYADTKEEPNRFEILIQNKLDRKKQLNKRIGEIENTIDDLEEEVEIKERKKLKNLKEEARKINIDINNLVSEQRIETVKEYGKEDLDKASKIISKEEITAEDIVEVLNIVGNWEKMGDFNRANPFLSNEELDEGDSSIEDIKKTLEEYANRASDIRRSTNNKIITLLNNKAFDVFNKDVKIELEQAITKLRGLDAVGIDISRVGTALYQTVYQLNATQEKETASEMKEKFDEIGELFRKIPENLVPTFIQQHKDGTPTGDLVHRFSIEFQDELDLAMDKLNARINAIAVSEKENKDKDYKKALSNFSREINKKAILLNPNKLFNEKTGEFLDTDEARAHINEIKNNVGESGAKVYYDKLKDKVDRYIKEKERNEKELDETYPNTEEGELAKRNERKQFDIRESPFYGFNHFNKPAWVNINFIEDFLNHIVYVPRKTINGKETGYYDKNFNRIMENPEARKFYGYIIKMFTQFSKLPPNYQTDGMKINSLPNVESNVLEVFGKDGMLAGFQEVLDSWKMLTATGKGGKEVTDPLKKEVQLKGFQNKSSEINSRLEERVIKHKQNTGNEATLAQKLQWKKEIRGEVAKRNPTNLDKVIMAYSAAMIAYKHKSKIEDLYKIMGSTIENTLLEAIENIEEYKDVKTSDLENLKKLLAVHINSAFGYSIKDRRTSSEKTVLKEKDKKEAKEINELLEQNKQDLKDGKITEEEYIKNDKKLNSRLEELFYYRNYKTVLEGINQYVRFKGLGWNIFSGFANLGFGTISNILLAADGRWFDQKDLNFAYKEYFDVTNRKKLKKIENLYDKYGIIQFSKQEAIDKKVYKGRKRFKRLAPYYPIDSTEKVNQATIMIARLRRIKVKLENETETTLYDIIDNEGNVPTKYKKAKVKTTPEGEWKTMDKNFMNRTMVSIGQLIKRAHGNYNYDSPIMADVPIVGRLLTTFRRWALEGFHQRWAGYTESDETMEGFAYRGRWKTWGHIYSKEGRPQGMNGFQVTTFTLKQLLKKGISAVPGIHLKTEFDQAGFTEEDAANMRANLTELYMLLVMKSTILGLISVLSGLDPEDEDTRWMLNLWVNQLGRIETDFWYYISPLEMQKLQRNIVPIASIVEDSERLLEHSTKLLGSGLGFRDDYDDFYHSGVYSQQRKSTKYIGRMLPAVNIPIRIDSLGKQVYD